MGGKMLGYGSAFTVIFTPCIQCKNKRYNRENKQVSKIFYGPQSYSDCKKEFLINEYIRKNLNNFHKYVFLWDKMCKPPLYKTILKYDYDIKKCINHDNINDKIFDRRSIMLIGNNAGSEMLSLWGKDLAKKTSLLDMINKHLVYIYHILLSVSELKDINVSHNDIHSRNIMIKNNKAKLIDFGLSGYLSNNSFVKERSNDLLSENRYFVPIPPDILFYKISSFKQIKYCSDLDGFEEFKNTHTKVLFKRNFDHQIKTLFNTLKTKLSKITTDLSISYRKLDIYSIGMLFAHLIYVYYRHKNKSIDNFKKVVKQNQYIKEFIELFNNMTHLVVKDRYTVNQALKTYEELLRKNNLL